MGRKHGLGFNVGAFFLVFMLLAMAAIITGCGGSGDSDVGIVTPPPPPPDTTPPENVTNLTAQPNDSLVTLQWQASANTAGDLAGYRIYQTIGAGTVSERAPSYEVGATTTELAIPNLTNNQRYSFKVTAFDTSNNESTGVSILVMPNTSGVIPSTNFDIAGGLINGAVKGATQTVTGELPTPPGSDPSTFAGTSYLNLNGNRIQLDMQPASSPADLQPTRMELKDGQPVALNGITADMSWLWAADRPAVTTKQVFKVTFSVNAGPNTISFEAFDLQGTLYARSPQWKSIGAYKPTALEVTLSWNTNKTDIDLHVSPDNGTTHCYYGNKTAGDMKLDYDDVDGYGPEHVTVDDVTGTKTYKIKVYYFADHNVDSQGNPVSPPTQTMATISATVNGQAAKIYPFNHTSDSGGVYSIGNLMSTPGTTSSWGSGPQVWDAGELTVKGANRFDVTLGEPDLSNWPTVKLNVVVIDPTTNQPAEGLTKDNFFVINSGTLMTTTSATDGGANGYTVQFTDITAGKRDIYVYVYAKIDSPTGNPPRADEVKPHAGGLSNTKVYGRNYALLVGLNEYPPANYKSEGWSYGTPNTTATATFKITEAHKTPDAASDFTATFVCNTPTPPGCTNVTTTGTAMTDLGFDLYSVTFPSPATPANYGGASFKFKKSAWLQECINDVTDWKAALLAKALQYLAPGQVGPAAPLSNTMWEEGNIQVVTNNQATKDAIFAFIDFYASVMNKYDLFFFHFSGHGSGMPADGNAKQYLCAYEDDKWINVTDFQAKLGSIPHKVGAGFSNTIIILDACFSGNFIGKGPAFGSSSAMVTGDNLIRWRPYLPQASIDYGQGLSFLRNLGDGTNDHVFVLTAVKGDKPSLDAIPLNNGAFTYYLIDGVTLTDLPTEKALANSNGIGNKDAWITGEEVYHYAAPKAEAWVHANYPTEEEKPQIFPNENGKTRLIYCW